MQHWCIQHFVSDINMKWKNILDNKRLIHILRLHRLEVIHMWILGVFGKNITLWKKFVTQMIPYSLLLCGTVHSKWKNCTYTFPLFLLLLQPTSNNVRTAWGTPVKILLKATATTTKHCRNKYNPEPMQSIRLWQQQSDQTSRCFSVCCEEQTTILSDKQMFLCLLWGTNNNPIRQADVYLFAVRNNFFKFLQLSAMQMKLPAREFRSVLREEEICQLTRS